MKGWLFDEVNKLIKMKMLKKVTFITKLLFVKEN